MRRLLVMFAAALGFAATSLPEDALAADEAVENCASCEAVMNLALAHPRRAGDRPRDQWRHPGETLAFFRVRPGMTVVDYMPSGGWYTRILVPYLGEDGRYIGLNPDVSGSSEQMKKYFGGLSTTLPAKAAEWTGVQAGRIFAYNTDGLPPALNGTVDRVLIFREMHNLKRNAMVERELGAVHALLKPDGMLGIVQHRARADAPDAYVDGNKGYLRERDVIDLVEAQGFELVAKSEVNANPGDPADHPNGVWTLPPNLRQGEADRDRFLRIGESDRMTLLFRKRT